MKTILIALSLASSSMAVPPELLEVPAFELKTSDAKNFGKKDLQGKVWVASFIFTSCGGQCPMLNAKTKELAKEFTQPDLRFVSVTVDPKTDTPKVLSTYKKKLAADDRWVFLTGPSKKIQALVNDGLKLAGGNSDSIAHSQRFVLIDSKGQVRGYYNALDEEKLAELKADLKTVLAEPKA